jgi:plastocyanin
MTKIEPALVKISGFSFDPVEIRISKGQGIVWQNFDGMGHTATRVSAPMFDTGVVAPGQKSIPKVFDQPTPPDGIEYFCRPHPFMKGRIIVT